MLQNRIDPWGNIIKTESRGAWMGNRGLIHNEHQQIVRPFRLKAWITCLLQFKGRQRKVMTPGLYTELFFLDEATALAAGHRPCAECRREDFNRFKSLWLKGNPGYNFNMKTSIQKIDDILHAERMNNDGTKVCYEEALGNIPNGAFAQHDGKAYLVWDGILHEWSPSGYTNTRQLSTDTRLQVLTPRSTVKTIQAGYRPQVSGGVFPK